VRAAPRGERRCLGARTHLIDLAEGSVPQLPHDLPHLAGIQVSPNVLVLLGTPFLKGGKAQDAAEISESHAAGAVRRAGNAAVPPPSYRQPPRALSRGGTELPAAARTEPEPLHLLACLPAAPPCHWPAPAPPGSARLGSARHYRAVLRCRAGPSWAAASRAGAVSAVGTRLGAGPHALFGRT